MNATHEIPHSTMEPDMCIWSEPAEPQRPALLGSPVLPERRATGCRVAAEAIVRWR